MADPTTPNLGLTQPTVGGDNNAWGSILNANWAALDAIFKGDGTGTGVGLNIGAGLTAWINGALKAANASVVDLFGAAVDFCAARLTLWDANNAGTGVQFATTGVSAGNVRTLSVPDKNGTLALTSDVSAAQTAATSAAESYADGVAATAQSNAEAYTDAQTKVLQVGYTAITAATDASNQMPISSSVPTSTQGTLVATASFTPKSATSKVIVEATIAGTAATAEQYTVALFVNGGANAVAAVPFRSESNAGCGEFVLRYQMTPGSTSAITFTFRLGPNTNGNIFHVNGAYGGVCASSVKITEYV